MSNRPVDRNSFPISFNKEFRQTPDSDLPVSDPRLAVCLNYAVTSLREISSYSVTGGGVVGVG